MQEDSNEHPDFLGALQFGCFYLDTAKPVHKYTDDNPTHKGGVAPKIKKETREQEKRVFVPYAGFGNVI